MSVYVCPELRRKVEKTEKRAQVVPGSLRGYRKKTGALPWFGEPSRAQRVRNGYVDLMCQFDLPVFASLTFRDEKRQSDRNDVGAISAEQAETVVMRYLAEIDQKFGGGVHGFLAMERQKRGSQHAHVVMWGPQYMPGWEENRRRLRNEKLEKSWADRAGFSIIEQIEDSQKLTTAVYLAKYVSKGGTVDYFDSNDLDQVRRSQEEQRALDVESVPCRWVNGTCVEHRCCGLRSRHAAHVGTKGRRRRYRRKQRYPVPQKIESHDWIPGRRLGTDGKLSVSVTAPAARERHAVIEEPGDSRALPSPHGEGRGEVVVCSSQYALQFGWWEELWASRAERRLARGHSEQGKHAASVSRRERIAA